MEIKPIAKLFGVKTQAKVITALIIAPVRTKQPGTTVCINKTVLSFGLPVPAPLAWPAFHSVGCGLLGSINTPLR